MGQTLTHLVDIQQRRGVGIVERGLRFVELDLLADLQAHLVVDLMPRAEGDDTPDDGAADEGEVPEDIEQLVTGRLVGEDDGAVIDVAQLGGYLARYAHQVADLVELRLLHRLVVDHEGVVEVAALDEVVLQQRLHLAHEDEGAAGGDLLVEVLQRLQGGELIAQHRRVEGHVHVHAELAVG